MVDQLFRLIFDTFPRVDILLLVIAAAPLFAFPFVGRQGPFYFVILLAFGVFPGLVLDRAFGHLAPWVFTASPAAVWLILAGLSIGERLRDLRSSS